MAVKPIPEGYATYTPYYVLEGASAFIDFLKAAFGASERMRMPMPGGRLGHAEVTIGSSVVMLADSNEHQPARKLNGMLYVDDVDAVYAKALAAGAKGDRPPANQFYGDRLGSVTDRWGNTWAIATHVEDVSPAEMKRRMDEMMKG